MKTKKLSIAIALLAVARYRNLLWKQTAEKFLGHNNRTDHFVCFRN